MASHWNFTMERDSLCFFYDKMQYLDEHAWNFWASITLSLDECPVLLWNSTLSVSLALTCIRLFLVHSLMISLVPAVCLAEEILQGSLESCDSCKCCKSSSGSVLDDNSWWSCNCCLTCWSCSLGSGTWVLQFLQVLQVFFWFILWWQNPVGAASVCLARLTLIWQILANPATVLSWQDMGSLGKGSC